MNKPQIKDGLLITPVTQRRKVTAADKEDFAKKIKKMRDRDREMVTGIFKNLENSASSGMRGAVRFTIKLYPGDEVQAYELWDNERYTIPRGVARHLNNNCYYLEHGYLPANMGGSEGMRYGYDKDGRMDKQAFTTKRKKHRFSFQSLEFMDDDAEMHPVDIVQVSASI